MYLCMCIFLCIFLYRFLYVNSFNQVINKTCFICYLYHNAVYMYILPIYGYIGGEYSSYCCTFLAVYAVRHYLLFIDMFSIVLGLGQGLDAQPLNRHRHILSNTLTHTHRNTYKHSHKHIHIHTQTYTQRHTHTEAQLLPRCPLDADDAHARQRVRRERRMAGKRGKGAQRQVSSVMEKRVEGREEQGNYPVSMTLQKFSVNRICCAVWRHLNVN